MAGEKLLKGLEKFQIKSNSENKIFEKLDKYIQEIILFNSAYNLTNTSDYDEISINHILDSISAAEQIKNLAQSLSKNEIKIADIGSGGGLPGIPLAIVLPEFQFFLVERMDKRCAFLENEKAILSLDNVTVIKSEAEKIASESFDITTFRAFRPLDSHFADTLLKITKPGGFLAAFKAKKSSIESEMSAIKTIIKEYKIFPLEVPFLTDSTEKKECRERNLVVVKKNI